MERYRPCHVEEMTRNECLDRLATATRGRLAISYRALPVIVPVRISLRPLELVITSLIGAAVPLPIGSVVAVEAGSMGDSPSDGWSVEVTGVLGALSAGRPDGDPDGSAPEAFVVSTEHLNGWRLSAEAATKARSK